MSSTAAAVLSITDPPADGVIARIDKAAILADGSVLLVAVLFLAVLSIALISILLQYRCHSQNMVIPLPSTTSAPWTYASTSLSNFSCFAFNHI
uniref:Small integral membrane protein 32 n=1 Tax=Syphacia muris TaxID=451379 RepID=A0A0N5ARH8_9BILA